MLKQQPSREQLLSEIYSLRQQLEELKREKADLEILLETTTEHSDTLTDDLQNKAEAAARASEKRLAQFLEAVPVGVAVFDTFGKLYYANNAAQQLLGKEILLSDISQQEIILKTLQGEQVKAEEINIQNQNQAIPIEVWGTPIFDDKGKLTYAIIAFQDITERKQSELERSNFTNQLFQLNQAYERFVPRQFLQFLHKESIVDVELGDQIQQEMSVLFADIRNFTKISESLTPAENFKFINSYLSYMEPAITQNNGFIDKYIGDGIMALFSGEVDHAVKAGIEMLQQLAKYNQQRQTLGQEPIQIGIGINTGSLMLGTVGGHSRMEGTVISDDVNLAARLEELTKYYGASLLISHQSFFQLENMNNYGFRLVDRVQVKGKTKLVSVFEIFDGDLPEIRLGKLLTKSIFEEGLLLYHQNNYLGAAQLFQDCLQANPQDTVAQTYLQRCKLKTDTVSFFA